MKKRKKIQLIFKVNITKVEVSRNRYVTFSAQFSATLQKTFQLVLLLCIVVLYSLEKKINSWFSTENWELLCYITIWWFIKHALEGRKKIVGLWYSSSYFQNLSHILVGFDDLVLFHAWKKVILFHSHTKNFVSFSFSFLQKKKMRSA